MSLSIITLDFILKWFLSLELHDKTFPTYRKNEAGSN